MVTSTLTALAALTLSAGARTGTPGDLGPFPGRVLKTWDEDELIFSAAKYLKSKGLKDEGPLPGGYRFDLTCPKMLLDWKGDGSLRVLVTGLDELGIPGSSQGGMFVIQSNDRIVAHSHFLAGHRTDLVSVRAGSAQGIGGVVRFLTRPSMNGRRDVAGFDLTLVGSRPAIIHVFDKNREPAPNIYYTPEFQLGPRPDLRQIAKELQSREPVQNLEALTWLPGQHLKASPDDLADHELRSDVKAFIRFWKSPEIRARIRTLCHSKLLWVRQVAVEALTTGGRTFSMDGF
jgi:hypothetical protein